MGSFPSSRSSSISRAVSRSIVAEYAPANPRSEEMARTATLFVSERSCVSGWWMSECTATAATAAVRARV